MQKTVNTFPIFFDFDGVIADSLHVAYEVNLLSDPDLDLETYKSYFNGNINDVQQKKNPVKLVDFFKEYGDRFQYLGLDERKRNIIRKLSEQSKLFIISSTTTAIIREYLERHGILDCFTEILGNEVDPHKTVKFRMLFEKYAIVPESVVFITDSSGDMREAQEVGIGSVVGILGGYQNEANLRAENPTRIVKDFEEFYEFVENI